MPLNDTFPRQNPAPRPVRTVRSLAFGIGSGCIVAAYFYAVTAGPSGMELPDVTTALPSLLCFIALTAILWRLWMETSLPEQWRTPAVASVGILTTTALVFDVVVSLASAIAGYLDPAIAVGQSLAALFAKLLIVAFALNWLVLIHFGFIALIAICLWGMAVASWRPDRT